MSTKAHRTCTNCREEAHWKNTGQWSSDRAATNWAIWGCTCDPQDEAEAINWMHRNTR